MLQKTATYCLSVPLYVHFSFSPMEISVTDFSAPTGASVFQILCTPSGRQSVCVNENKDAYPYFAFFFSNFNFFLLSLLYNTKYIWTFFLSKT